MSERKRKRGRPRVAPAISYGNDIRMRNSIPRKIQKPKYLMDSDELEQSRESTPARSIDTDRSSASGRGRTSRSYNPDIDHDSEYHYGSDFELEDESDNDDKESSSSRLSSRMLSDIEESDMEFDLNGEDSPNGDHNWKFDYGLPVNRNTTPVPVWLQDRSYPPLVLCKSSDDLLIPKHQVLKATGIYEVLRHFHSMARVSPFRLEDFCASLICDEMNVLMTEIHIALLKALIREDDLSQNHFGPLDQKDSTNVILYFIDPLTWPENLKLYLQSDKDFSRILRIVEQTDYPITSLDNRLMVLQFLCDQFLQTSGVRDDVLNDGKVRYDDHCRVCHKTGDLLCCDSCSAVYHLDCADPPLKQSPSELEDWTCKVCKSHELMGVSDCVLPMEASGVLCRQEPLGYDRHGRKYWFLTRRIIVEAESGEIWYYSTVDQFELLIYLMDSEDLESNLYIAFKEFGDDIRRQMHITEKLTDKARGSYLTCLMTDRESAIKMREEVRIKRENEIKMETDNNLEVNVETNEIFAKVDLDDIKNEEYEPPDEHGSLLLMNEKRKQLSMSGGKAPPKLNDDVSFRLGCDHNYKNYINQYSTNVLALNKLQHNEERDKKRHLNHKMSLGSANEFKWTGPTYGPTDSLISTIRQTILALEQNISPHFFHTHWHHIRKSWQQSTVASLKPIQIAKVLRWLTNCVKPAVYCPIWNDSIGHVKLKKITAGDREEKKKQEKRDKKEAEEESRLHCNVRYKRSFPHQLWKMKGEEYRIHGLWGWQWLSIHRKLVQKSQSECGLRAGPEKISIPIKTGEDSSLRGLPITNAAFKQLANKNPKLNFSISSPNQLKLEENPEDVKQSDLLIYNQGVQQKVQVLPIDLENYLEDGVVNVSKSLLCENRFVYPKLCQASVLDSLLERRVALQDEEIRQIEAKKLVAADEDHDSDATISDDEGEHPVVSQKSPLPSSKSTGHILKEMRLYKLKYEELDKNDDGASSCYSALCKLSGRSTCYSPLCILKEKTKEKLIHCVNEYKLVCGKSAPFDQAGINVPIKFDELETKRKSKSPVKNNLSFPRIYSTDNTKLKIFLKKKPSEKPKPPYRLPQPSTFRYPHLGKDKPHRYSILVLPKWESKVLARKGGRLNVSGFMHNAKTNQGAWPYPCSRPSFKTMWQYRTATMNTLTAAALQVRILWNCFRWEDMSEKPPIDGKKQITTDTEMITTQILKRKTYGRFLNKTEYLIRKIVIPLDVPRPMREFTPSQRSGLRKRRRAMSPINKEPESAEVWVEEEKLCLWEVKYFGDRLEKAAMLSKKVQTQTERCNELIPTARSGSPAELKAKLDEQLKIRRTNLNPKKTIETGYVKVAVGGNSLPSKTVTSSPSVITIGNNLPMAGRKIVTTKGGKIITVQANSNISGLDSTKKVALGRSSVFPVSSVPKVQVGKSPQVLKIQSVSAGRQRTILPRSTNSVTPSTPKTSTSIPVIRANPTGQQIQIVKLPDGHIQVKGLQEGQKVFQREDGKLQLISKPAVPITSPGTLASAIQSPTKENQRKNIALGSNQIVKINGQQVLLRANNNAKPVVSVNQVGSSQVIKTPVVPAKPIKATNLVTGKLPTKNAAPPKQETDSSKSTSIVSLQVQVKMTEQGPKTIILGLAPGVGLTKDHLMAIQQHVKTMLSTKPLKVNELSPLLKVDLNIPYAKAPPTQPAVKKVDTKVVVTKPDVSKVEAKDDSSKLPKKLIVTNDYIQKSIKSALSQTNLSSDVAEKLMQLQKYTTEKSDSDTFLNKIQDSTGVKPGKRSRDQEDADWDGEDVAKGKSKRAKTEKTKSKRESTTSPAKAVLQDAKKKQAKLQKLDVMLTKYMEGLKKTILKKRAYLEKDLQLHIHSELSAAKQHANVYERTKPTENSTNRKRSLQSPVAVSDNKPQNKKAVHPSPTKVSKTSPKTKKTSKSKSKKIVCICRTPFDDTKFYVGCDLCANWFHGDCIGINETTSQSMTEYVCDDCANAKLNKELFCFCKQPYDETQFYICCERCNDWYHGKCIGIMQVEADDIDDYICPKCDSNNKWNYACQKKLTSKDYIELKKVAKSIVQHKNAWPFLEAVDASEVPDYYKVVKEPMDLKTIEKNVNLHKYNTLCEFVGHVMLVLDNCRAYNPPTSSFSSCAVTLETFFSQRLKQLKQKIGGKS